MEAGDDEYGDDDITPADPPSAAIVRLAEHQRELCSAFDRVAPLLSEAARSDRVFLLDNLIDICAEGERAFRDCGQALMSLRDLENVFRLAKKGHP